MRKYNVFVFLVLVLQFLPRELHSQHFMHLINVSNRPDTINTGPELAVDGAGFVHIAWQSFYVKEGAPDGVASDIYYTDNVSGSFAPPVKIPVSAKWYSRDPSIAVDASGHAHIVFRRSIDQMNVSSDDDIYYSANSSGAFSDPLKILTGGHNPQIHCLKSGEIAVIFEYTAGMYLIQKKAGAWNTASQIYNGSPSMYNSALDQHDALHLILESEDGLQYTHNMSGSFVTPIPLPNPNKEEQSTPKIAVDSNQKVHVVYRAPFVTPGSPDIFYITNAGGTFGTAAPVCDFSTFYIPIVAVDSTDHVHIAYKITWPYGGFLFYLNNLAGSFDPANALVCDWVDSWWFPTFQSRYFALGKDSSIHFTFYQESETGTDVFYLRGVFKEATGSCLSITPETAQFETIGGSGTVSVIASADCAWSAVSNNSWISVTSGTSGKGNGSVGYTVAPNSGPRRVGTITIGDKTFVVSQAECEAPGSSGDPQDATILNGQTARLEVKPTGSEPFSFQWYQGESGDLSHPIQGTNSRVYTTPPLSQAARFWVRVTNVCGSHDSVTVTITVVDDCKPVITAQPQSLSARTGEEIQFTVGARGCTPLTYAWYEGSSGDTSAGYRQQSSTNASSNTYRIYSGLQSSSSYWVRVSNSSGTIGSDTAFVRANLLTPKLKAIGMDSKDVGFVAIDKKTPTTVYAGTSYYGVYKTSDAGSTWNPANQGLTNNEITALLVDTVNPSTLYVGTNQGGVFRTTDGGSSWKAINTGLTNQKIGALAISPHDAKTLYAATSGPLFRSTDEGLTWSVLYTGFSDAVNVFLVSPHDSHALFAGTEDGVFKSTDSGVSWRAVNSGLACTSIWSMTLHPSDPKVLILGTASFPGGGIFKSSDAGETWTACLGGHPPHFARSVMFDPLDSNIVYAGGDFLFRSVDTGESWQTLSASFVGYFQSIAMDPLNPDIIYLGMDSGVRRLETETRLLFPFYQNGAGRFAGFAISNPFTVDTKLSLTLRGTDGKPVTSAGNPFTQTLPASHQLARVGPELFGAGADSQASGWVEMTSTNTVGAFFQFGTMDVSQMDGSVAFNSQSKVLYFTRVLEGASAFRGLPAKTRLHIINPNSDSARIKVNLYGSTPGQKLASEQSRTIPANGSLHESVSEMFGSGLAISSGFIKVQVSSGTGVVGFESIELGTMSTVIGLNASFGNPESELFSAQLANVSGLFTDLKLVNPSLQGRSVELTAIDDNGVNLAPPMNIVLQAGALYEKDVSEIFTFSPGKAVVGTLRVKADGSEVIGDVIFGETTQLSLAAALPLQTAKFRHAIFSQVANGLGLFTGVALYNPNDQAADATIETYTDDGQKSGETNPPIQLPAGARLSKVLPELLPSTAGQVRGYVVIRSNRPLVAQQLFGTVDLLSAVPPTVVR